MTKARSNAVAPAAKGDLQVGNGSLTSGVLGVGSDGYTLVADSSQTTGLNYSGNAGANLLANGSFDIWQRGTGAFTAPAIYTADRWYVYSQQNYSLSQETLVVPDGATNAAKVTITSANGYCNLQNTLEQSDVEKLAGKTVTFSVYLRANATYNGSFSVQILYSTTGNSQTPTWTSLTATSHTPSTSAYTRVTVTGTIPTTAKGITFYVGQNSVLANGSIYYIALAKAEIGAVATPWSRLGNTIQGELAACQRYYYKLGNEGLNGMSFNLVGAWYSTTRAQVTSIHPVTMRTTPSYTLVDGGFFDTTGARKLVTASSSNASSSKNLSLDLTSSGGTAGAGGYLCEFASGNGHTAGTGYLEVSAEL